MTLPIHDAGGLTDAEIRLLIEQAKEVQVTTLDQKLKEHTEVIDKRLCATDASVKDNLDRTIDLKANVAVLMASNDRQTKILEDLRNSGEKWHDADLEYRSTMIERVTAIEGEQKRISGQVQIIRWFVATSSGVTKTLGVCLRVLTTEEFWKVFGTAFLLYLLAHFAPHLFHSVQNVIKGE